MDLNIKNIGKRRSKHGKRGIKHKARRSRKITYKQAWKNMGLIQEHARSKIKQKTC